MSRLCYVGISLTFSAGPSLLTGFLAYAAHRDLAVAALCAGAVYLLCARYLLKGCYQ